MSSASDDCICGTRIVVIVGKECQGVAAHNATSAHQKWREWGGMERVVYGPTSHQLLVDALESQVVVDSAPATWTYRHGHRLSA